MASTTTTTAKKKKKTNKYNYEFDASLFDFEAAADPPDSYQCSLQWMHQGWNKSMSNMVMTRYVREAFDECHGIFPHFAAPELLNEANFRKFCFYADKHHLSEVPESYLPMYYRNKPEEWTELKRQRKERMREFVKTEMGAMLNQLLGLDDTANDEHDDDDEDEDDDMEEEEEEQDSKPAAKSSDDNEEDSIMVPSSSNADNTTRLLDMDMNVRSAIALYLDPLNWCSLRTTCKEAKEWPIPTVDYDFIYFAISNSFDTVYQGVAHAIKDVKEAIMALQRTQGRELWNHGSLCLALTIVKFDREKHPIVPLLKFQDYQYYGDPYPAELDELGEHYFGVKSAFPFPMAWISFFDPEDKDSFPIFEDENDEKKWKRYNNLKPQSYMNLEHIGIRELCCTYCGQGSGGFGLPVGCMCDIRFGGHEKGPDRVGPGGDEGNEEIIYYSPAWFGGDSNGQSELVSGPEGAKEKSWIIWLDEIRLWDRY